jgi:hypothetical protein
MSNTFIYTETGVVKAIRVTNNVVNQLCIYTLEENNKYKFMSIVAEWKRVRRFVFDRVLVGFVDSVLSEYFVKR